MYDNWEECKLQVAGFEQAKYKSFASKEEAYTAYASNPSAYLVNKSRVKLAIEPTNVNIIRNSLAVDAACSGNPGDMEYRGVYIETGKELFRMGPYKKGTNNIGEFLAIVHGLALLKKNNSSLPIYSDSRNAILWVKAKKCKTKLEQTSVNAPIFDLIERAEVWLRQNTYSNNIIKWETSQWGEIPADFGRK